MAGSFIRCQNVRSVSPKSSGGSVDEYRRTPCTQVEDRLRILLGL